MTTATLIVSNGTIEAERPRRSLEDLADRHFAALSFGDEPEPPADPALPDLPGPFTTPDDSGRRRTCTGP